jgi:shikimate dehydrogenase
MQAADDAPISRAVLRAEQKVIDTIYVFEETATMREARAVGAETVNGLGMLLHQGVQSLRIWTGEDPPVEVMRDALGKAVYEKG